MGKFDQMYYAVPFLIAIERMATTKELLRHHHIYTFHRTNQGFETWWEREYIGKLVLYGRWVLIKVYNNRAD